MDVPDGKPRPGEYVILKTLPPGLSDGLPLRDKRAITAIVGKPVVLVGYDDVGRAELEFVDKRGDNHSIWVGRKFIESA